MFLDMFLFVVAFCITFALGYLTAYLNKGITIIHKTHDEAPTEYNESLAKELPPEVQAYYDDPNNKNW